MAAIYSNGGNRWNILGFNLLKEMRYLVYIRYRGTSTYRGRTSGSFSVRDFFSLPCSYSKCPKERPSPPENILKFNVPGGE